GRGPARLPAHGHHTAGLRACQPDPGARPRRRLRHHESSHLERHRRSRWSHRRLHGRLGLHGPGGPAGDAPADLRSLSSQPGADGRGQWSSLPALPPGPPRRRGHGRGHRRPEIQSVRPGRQPALRSDGADGGDHGKQERVIIQQLIVQVEEVVRHLGWAEIVDVAVIALILYYVLRLVRGTQGTQILVGLVLLALIGALATTFNLVLLAWLFRNGAGLLAIAIIVIFQPELRRAVDQLGRLGNLGRPLSAFSTPQYSQAISETIRAAERLSAKRTGALIAFERDVGLEDYAATGVRINGEISAEVLQSIFYPNSPLHDGAVIVRGNRILAAGCLLPLPEEGTVRERLGTRHRAALGLSLASDALVLVVSEETGAISVIEEGKITRNLDADGLRRRVSVKVPARLVGANRMLGFLNGRANGEAKERENVRHGDKEKDA
ncbi:MAG: TIGR00159 family protein, partial [Chloroflexi bacterium]